jgi:hypothetical protein
LNINHRGEAALKIPPIQKTSVPHPFCHPERSGAESKDLLFAFIGERVGNPRPQSAT